jgi:thymidylate synthase/dihydrofolate reductase
MSFDIIAAVSGKGLSRGGNLPWRDTPAGRLDMKHFVRETAECVVVMGRKTFATCGPLKSRANVVVSRSLTTGPGVTPVPKPWDGRGGLTPARFKTDDTDTTTLHLASSFDLAVEFATSLGRRVWVIGGAEIYAAASAHPRFGRAVVSHIPGVYLCDVHYPVDAHVRAGEHMVTHEETGLVITQWHSNREELAYLRLVEELLRADIGPDRTGAGTHAVFGRTLRFNLAGGVLPMLTTKRVSFATVARELLWFLRGSTDTSYLVEHGVGIWAGNSSAEYLKSVGLDYPAGTVGPVYGYQWRNWNGCWADGNSSGGRGIDQLAGVIEEIKTNPHSRRLLVTAWNPEQNDGMALPPCHYSFQFNVKRTANGPFSLDILVNMRSADIALGVPYNIVSYALLCHIVAKICGLAAGELVLNMGNCHLYTSHAAAAREQVGRSPMAFPRVGFSERFQPDLDWIAANAGPLDFPVSNYNSWPAVKYPMEGGK